MRKQQHLKLHMQYPFLFYPFFLIVEQQEEQVVALEPYLQHP